MKQRTIFGDFIRSIAIFMVLIIHCTANYYVDKGAPLGLLFISSITCTAVPLFYMISGCFNIKKESDFNKKYLIKILKRILQLLFWTLIYLLIFKYILHQDVLLLKHLIKSIFSSQVGHLWFMYPLISLYILNPIISKLYYSLNERQLKIFILISFIIPTILSTISRIYPGIINIQLFALGWPELGIYILGKYLYDSKKYFENKKLIISSLIFAGFIFIILYAKFDISQYGVSSFKPYFDYGSFPCALLTLSLFMFILSINDNLERLPKIIRNIILSIGNCSSGIYYIHMIPIYLFGSISILGIVVSVNETRIISMILGATFYFIISYIITNIIKKIPYVNMLID